MRSTLSFAALLAACTALAGCRASPAHADRCYVIPVGTHRVLDVSPWTPGEGEGQPWVFGNHCCLVVHPRGILLWDTGYADEYASRPEGVELAGGAIRIHAGPPLRAQLAAIGFAPEQVTHLAFSHLHLDHAGNAGAFPAATVYLQQLEHDAAFGPDAEERGYEPALYAALRERRLHLLRGDHDVFGDGAVVLLSTPGHTPGHQSLLVRLAAAGPHLFAGDLAHLRANWERRRAPATNFDRAMTVRSMARLAEVLGSERATLVLLHERDPGPALPLAPDCLR